MIKFFNKKFFIQIILGLSFAQSACAGKIKPEDAVQVTANIVNSVIALVGKSEKKEKQNIITFSMMLVNNLAFLIQQLVKSGALDDIDFDQLSDEQATRAIYTKLCALDLPNKMGAELLRFRVQEDLQG